MGIRMLNGAAVIGFVLLLPACACLRSTTVEQSALTRAEIVAKIDQRAANWFREHPGESHPVTVRLFHDPDTAPMVYSPAYRQAELECRALSGRMRAFRGAVGQPYQHPDIEVRRAYHALEVELEGAIALLYRALDESQVRQRQNLSELRSQAWAEIERQLLRYDGVRVYGPVPYSLVVSSAAHLDAIASSLDVRYVSLTVVRKRETDHE